MFSEKRKLSFRSKRDWDDEADEPQVGPNRFGMGIIPDSSKFFL
jgi:hypothetical protein